MLVNEKIKSLEVYKKELLDMTFCKNCKNIEKINITIKHVKKILKI